MGCSPCSTRCSDQGRQPVIRSSDLCRKWNRPWWTKQAKLPGWNTSRVNHTVGKYNDPVICTYDLTNFSASLMMDMLRVHPAVIVGGVLQENPFFVPPDQFLLELRERKSARSRAIQAH